MPAAVRNKKDGQVYGFDDLIEAQKVIASGAGELAEPIGIVNPKDGHEYAFDNIDEAIRASGVKAPKAAPAKDEEPGIIESGLRGIAKGLTFDFADELSGLAESTFTNKPYEQARAESEANFQRAAEANPITDVVGQVAGGVGQMLIPGAVAGKVLGAGSKVTQALQGAAKLAKANPVSAAALAGAAQSAGVTQGDTVGEMAGDVALGGAIGGGLGLAGKMVGGLKDTVAGHASTFAKAHFEPRSVLGDMGKIESKALGEALSPVLKRGTGEVIDTETGRTGRALDRLFEKLKSAKDIKTNPDVQKVMLKAQGEAEEVFDEVRKAVAKKPSATKFVAVTPLPDGEIEKRLAPELAKVVDDVAYEAYGTTTGRRPGEDVLINWLHDADRSDLSQLYKAKQLIGKRARQATADGIKASPDDIVMQQALPIVSDIFETRLGQVSPELLDKYRLANSDYEMVSALLPAFQESLGSDTKLMTAMGGKLRDYFTASGVSAGAAALGADAGVSGALGIGAGAGSAMLRSIPGKIARAKLGNFVSDLKVPAAVGKGADFLGALNEVPATVSRQVAAYPARKTPQEKALARIKLEESGLPISEIARRSNAIQNDEE